MTAPKPDLTPAEHAERVMAAIHRCTSEGMSEAESSLAALVEMAKQYVLLARAVNQNSGECSGGCDSYGHAEDCGYTDMALSLRLAQERAEKAEAERDRMREALEMLQLAALKPETSKGEMLAFLDGVLEPHVHIVAKETK